MRKPILQVEDSSDDARLTELGFRKAGVTNPIITLTSGEEAISYFRGEGIYADRKKFPIPAVLLIDIKLPGISGFELMEVLVKEAWHNGIVIVLTSGHDELYQLRRGYTLGAHTFLTKPVRDQDLINLIEAFPAFWSFEQPGPTWHSGTTADP